MTVGSRSKAWISGMLSPFLQPRERTAPRRLGHGDCSTTAREGRGTRGRATQNPNPGDDGWERDGCTPAEAKRGRTKPFPGLGTCLEHGLACEPKLCASVSP